MALEIKKGSADFKFGWSNPEQLEEWLKQNPTAIGVAFVGRSNVGKSSSINALFGRGVARVSKTPGRTREINAFTFTLTNDGKDMEGLPPLFLFDLPGYGHAKVSKEMSQNWNVLMSTFFGLTSERTLMVNLQDCRHPNQEADRGFQKFLKPFNFETVLAFNKIDKLKKQKERAALNKLKPTLFSTYKWVKTIHFMSAESKAGVKEVHDSIIAFIAKKLEQQ